MANGSFLDFRKWLLRRFSGDELRLALTSSSLYTVNLTSHTFLSDVATTAILAEGKLTGVTIPAGTSAVDATDFSESFQDFNNGQADAAFYYKPEIADYAIASLSGQTFQVVGDQTADFRRNQIATVDSGGNAGDYWIKVSSYSASINRTLVEMRTSVPSTDDSGVLQVPDASASRLLLWIDNATGLPLTLDGASDSVIFNQAGFYKI